VIANNLRIHDAVYSGSGLSARAAMTYIQAAIP